MADVSAMLFSSLPLSSTVAGKPSSVALQQPPADLQGTGSLRLLSDNSVSNNAETSDFGPRDPTQTGFASLGPAIKQLNTQPPETTDTTDEDSKPLWKQLLEQQQRRTEARRAALAEEEARREAIRQAEIEQLRQQQIAELSGQSNATEPVPVLGQQDPDKKKAGQAPALAATLPGQPTPAKSAQDNSVSLLPGTPGQSAEAVPFKPVFNAASKQTTDFSFFPLSPETQTVAATQDSQRNQLRIQQSLNPAQNGQTIDFFA